MSAVEYRSRDCRGAIALHNIGVSLLERGQFQEGLRTLKAALSVWRHVLEADDPGSKGHPSPDQSAMIQTRNDHARQPFQPESTMAAELQLSARQHALSVATERCSGRSFLARETYLGPPESFTKATRQRHHGAADSRGAPESLKVDTSVSRPTILFGKSEEIRDNV